MYGYYHICSSIHLLMDTWVAPTFWVLWIMLLWTWLYPLLFLYGRKVCLPGSLSAGVCEFSQWEALAEDWRMGRGQGTSLLSLLWKVFPVVTVHPTVVAPPLFVSPSHLVSVLTTQVVVASFPLWLISGLPLCPLPVFSPVCNCGVRFKVSSMVGHTQHSDTRVDERQNSLLLLAPDKRRLSGWVAKGLYLRTR